MTDKELEQEAERMKKQLRDAEADAYGNRMLDELKEAANKKDPIRGILEFIAILLISVAKELYRNRIINN